VTEASATDTEPSRALTRDTDAAMLGGVCAGIAARLGVSPLGVRILAVILALGAGIGVPLYLAGWLWMPPSSGGPSLAARIRGRPGAWQAAAGLGMLTLAALLTARKLGLWWNDAISWPLVIAVFGGALLWRQTAGRPAEPPPSPQRPRDPVTAEQPAPSARRDVLEKVRAYYQGGFGIALVAGATVLFLQANGALTGARDIVLSVVAVAVGLGLVLAPFWVRMARRLAAERAERVRSQERAEMAAHLHDSVLQTLALMQKRADDPRAVATLARRQERELRAWLSGAPAARPDERLADALRAAAEEVEEGFGVPVEAVIVGDRELDDRCRALVAAAREALVNAAKHAPGEPISLYAEATDGRVEAFVRDRGPGFDPDAVPPDRRGVRESIVGRMASHGGRAEVRSAPGAGTEVELVLEDPR